MINEKTLIELNYIYKKLKEIERRKKYEKTRKNNRKTDTHNNNNCSNNSISHTTK